MPPWKRAILGAWYYGSYAYRWRQERRARVAGAAPIIVLTYHRVADDAANSWTIAPRDFEQQIDWLSRNYELISLAEAQRRIRGRRNDETAVAITFDDGYAVNSEWALPLVIQRKIPVTYFVCTDPVIRGTFFPHDLKMGNRFAPNSIAQLRSIARAGIEIGAHTRCHADLGPITNPLKLYDEIVAAGEELQAAVGSPVRYFAFPYGGHANMNDRAFHLAYDAGFEGVCSAYGGYNWPGDDAFHIQRICVDGPLLRTKNWVTVDPYKLWSVKRFSYSAQAEIAHPEEAHQP